MTSVDRKKKRKHRFDRRGTGLGGSLELRLRVSVEFVVIGATATLLAHVLPGL
ncbi:hypothetical protein [Microbacterium sp.]|uniref:hypothetical protein n=1 Tax=Microbacterium sp. TaxID=51671 RepID=UPI0028111D6D|nr:hypothetical protein [Microbacterium sp.]